MQWLLCLDGCTISMSAATAAASVTSNITLLFFFLFVVLAVLIKSISLNKVHMGLGAVWWEMGQVGGWGGGGKEQVCGWRGGFRGAGMNAQSIDCRDKRKLIHSVCVVTLSYIAT